MYKKYISIIFCLAYFNILIAGTTGNVRGKVFDSENNSPIIGANVFLDKTALGTVTDENGNYFIINIPPGEYTLRSSYIGYSSVIVKNVQVSIDRSTSKDIYMDVEVIEGGEVIVIAERPLIERDRTSSASFTSAKEIDLMPVQEVEDIIALQAGVVKDSDGNFHLRGGRHGEIAYLIDGVMVSNQFSGGSSVGIQNNWIQELQVISGAFNAEYGKAQSGIVNIVTKDGPKNFGGSFSSSFGDHLSNNESTFYNIDQVTVNEVDNNFEFHGPLSFLNNGSFLVSARQYNSSGWLFGKNVFDRDDTVPIQQFIQIAQMNMTDQERLAGIEIPDSLMTGDGDFVPLNNRKTSSYFSKITFFPLKKLKISFSSIYNYNKGKSYSNSRRYSPYGVPTSYSKDLSQIISFNHMLSNKIFYTLTYSNYSNESKRYLFQDELDNYYQGVPFSSNGFLFGGTSNSRNRVDNSSSNIKLDLTAQVNQYNQMKIGFDYKINKLDFLSLTTIAQGPVTALPELSIPDQNTSGNNRYDKSPIEASFYIQNKLESDELIINAGLRYDFWNAKSIIPTNLRATTKPNDGIRLDSDYEPSKEVVQISPRFGMAYNFSEDGVVHVSYGHFFQIPRFQFVFDNSEFEIELGGLQTIMGNANIQPEKTITFELGLQQQINKSISIDLAIYNKTIRDLLSQEIINTSDKKVYARYINRDYGNVRGIAASLDSRNNNNFSWGIDYTYQIAKGNASDPNAVFVDFQTNPPKEGEKQVVPLDWDQRHTLNGDIAFSSTRGLSISLLGRISTGQPYTPSNPGSQLTTQFENSDNKPSTYTFDLNARKFFNIISYKVNFFVKIFNIFDRLNQKTVYSSTGNAHEPYRTEAERELLLQNPNLTLDQINLRPNYFSEPRKIIIGIKTSF
ncbi:MAG: TonB-dependent receptor [Candidatus Marinimicrobia bacterium]|nr:TonB-dependent receptor [Candidatus Neomarinimicrobiota bacterium]